MTRSELRTVRQLAVADLLEISDDVRLFRVVRIVEPPARAVDGKRKVYLRSIDGSTQVMLVRDAREQVRVVITH